MIEKSLILSRDPPRVVYLPWIVATAYLAALGVAEVLTTLIAPLVGMILHGLIFSALLSHAAFSIGKSGYRFLAVLALAPLVRLLSLALPLNQFPPIYQYLVIGIPLFLAAFLVGRATGLQGKLIGLRLPWRSLPLQLLIGITGILLGYIEYLILHPEPLVVAPRWELTWLPVMILLIFTGLLEEIIFRGMMQTSSLQYLGRWGIFYVAILYAIMHLGYWSLLNFLFVFAVAISFGIIVRKTGSIVGVSLSHGLTNVSLYLLFPFILAGPLT